MDITDLEMTRRCADAMEFKPPQTTIGGVPWNPLAFDAQAFTLLVYLLNSGVRVVVENNAMKGKHYGMRPVMMVDETIYEIETPAKFRRAIVACVSRIQKEKR